MSRPGRTQPTFAGSVDDRCPPGFHRLHRERHVGAGAADFESARSAVLSWRFLQRAGLRIEATSPRPVLAAIVRQQLGPVVAPCQIVAVFDEPTRAGFSYATMPGHPERGVERFAVEHRADDTVRCLIDSISRAASWYARLGGPVTRFLQARMVNRYLAAIAEEVSASRRG